MAIREAIEAEVKREREFRDNPSMVSDQVWRYCVAGFFVGSIYWAL